MNRKPLTLLALSILILVIATGCKKGDTGPAGPQGQQGTAGVVGPAGADGTIMYSGTTAPAAALGKPGDYYIDLYAGLLYGPKSSSGWGGGYAMRGSDGVAGKNGTQIYAGTGAPGSTLGVTGDFFVDTVAHDLYGPKLAAGWGIPVALQGSTGPAGPQGPAGTANVQFTPWFTPDGNWNQFSTTDLNSIYYNQGVPAITSDVLNKGAVLVFAQLDGYPTSMVPGGSVTQLPITIMFNMNSTSPNPLGDTWESFATLNNIRIQFTNSVNAYSIPNNFPHSASQFRLVIIPGGVSVPANIGYKELKGYLHVNIPD
jgi:hypothetical protein